VFFPALSLTLSSGSNQPKFQCSFERDTVTEDTPGRYLKEVRERLRIGLREVQEASAGVVAQESNDRFYISAARLTQIENGQSVPSVFKLFSLCAIYGLDLYDLLRRYGVNPNRTQTYQTKFLAQTTREVSAEIYGTDDKITIPVRLDPSFRWETTQLVNRVVSLWGEIPAAFLLSFNPRRHTYGYVGLADRTMFPLLRPGAMVMIDSERRNVAKDGWTTEFDRPIYFIEMRDGYRCAWCQVEGNRLMLIPHPIGGMPVQTFSLASEAEVVGQVVGTAMRLVLPETSSPAPEAKSPVPLAPAK
jgi:transcriptional regulator with XRE-family HTH domain